MNAGTVDLLVRIERATHEEAKAFAVVAVDEGNGQVVSATGPFAEAEAALIQAGRDEATMKREAEPGEPGWRHVVVPLWEPTP